MLQKCIPNLVSSDWINRYKWAAVVYSAQVARHWYSVQVRSLSTRLPTDFKISFSIKGILHTGAQTARWATLTAAFLLSSSSVCQFLSLISISSFHLCWNSSDSSYRHWRHLIYFWLWRNKHLSIPSLPVRYFERQETLLMNQTTPKDVEKRNIGLKHCFTAKFQPAYMRQVKLWPLYLKRWFEWDFLLEARSASCQHRKGASQEGPTNDKLRDYGAFLSLCPDLKVSLRWQRKPPSGSGGGIKDPGWLSLHSHVLTQVCWSHFLSGYR